LDFEGVKRCLPVREGRRASPARLVPAAVVFTCNPASWEVEIRKMQV
jgi:hypothetical protein